MNLGVTALWGFTLWHPALTRARHIPASRHVSCQSSTNHKTPVCDFRLSRRAHSLPCTLGHQTVFWEAASLEMTADGSFRVGWKFCVSAFVSPRHQTYPSPGHFIVLYSYGRNDTSVGRSIIGQTSNSTTKVWMQQQLMLPWLLVTCMVCKQ